MCLAGAGTAAGLPEINGGSCSGGGSCQRRPLMPDRPGRSRSEGGAIPFPDHEPWCPFQIMPVGSECTCGEAEAEYRRRYFPQGEDPGEPPDA